MTFDEFVYEHAADDSLDLEAIAERARVAGFAGTNARLVEAALRRREVRRLAAEGMRRAEIVTHTGLSRKTVDRTLRRGSNANRYTDAEKERLAILAGEGMPIEYIAEDLRRSPHRLGEIVLQRGLRPAGAVKEWRSAWSGIRRRPELVALHYEFHPATGRRAA